LPKPLIKAEVNKEVLTQCLTVMSLDVKSFVNDEAADITHGNETRHGVAMGTITQLQRTLMSHLDGVMTTQGNAVKKINQLVKEVQGLKATDVDMSEKLSGLIRCSAHGSIKVHQELVTLNAAAEDSRLKLSSELKTQTRSMKSNQNHAKQQLGGQLVELMDVVDHQVVAWETVRSSAEGQTVELKTVKDNTDRQIAALYTVKRSDFNSDGEYVSYVKQHIRVGMKIRFCSDGGQWRGLARGDVGTVQSFNKSHVWVDWSGNVCKGGCYFYDIELLG